MTSEGSPYAFVSYSFKDGDLARQIAKDFLSNGIDTFFAEWDIQPGASIRQKIDEGLEQCTHFIALLTPQSVEAPWVKTEMDAAFVRKVSGRCTFIAVRAGITAEQLPPLLRGLYAPALNDYDKDVRGLIGAIHGITEKPPRGPAPVVVESRLHAGVTGLSAAAEMIARIMIERSEHGNDLDPQIEGPELRSLTQLADEDIIDAIDELHDFGYVRKLRAFGEGSLGFSVVGSEDALFSELDHHYKTWNPAEDALKIASELVNGDPSRNVPSLADAWGWAPRRINPAINWLRRRDLIQTNKEIVWPWTAFWLYKTAETRRFLRSQG